MTKRTTRAAGAAPGAEGKRPRGRPPKLTHALTEAVCKALATGAPITVCAQRYGFNRDTYYAWLARGLDDLEEGRRTAYADFATKARVAVAEGELGYWEAIREASQSARSTKKDGPPANKPAVVAAKAAAAKVALNALRTRWGKRYKTYSETRRADADLPEELLPPPEEPAGDIDPRTLPPEKRRQYLALVREMQAARRQEE